MKKNIKNNRALILSFGCCLLLLWNTACKKFVQVDPPQDQVIAAVVFQDDKTAISALDGLYSIMMNGNMIWANGALTIFPGLSADEIINTSSGFIYDAFIKNTIPASEFSTNYNRLWRNAYSYIYRVNDILNAVEHAPALSAPVIARLKGEAKFWRAFCYYYLVNLYGDVPLLITPDYKINAIAPRTNLATVMQLIISDLKEAQGLLIADYPSAGKVYVNRSATTALLARVYLYQQNWFLSESAATEVLNTGMYTLENNLSNVFLAASHETILSLAPGSQGFNTSEGYAFIPSPVPAALPQFIITDSLLNAFEPGDLRKNEWVGTKTINGQIYYFPYKYKVSFSFDILENNIVLRLAEQYLIRAEARAWQNNIAGAIEDLNILRQRAGLELLPVTLSQPECLLAIAKERRIELFAEWGHRWFDLKRTGQADAALTPLKPSWKVTAVLYPIPQNDMDKNPFLVQNPGY